MQPAALYSHTTFLGNDAKATEPNCTNATANECCSTTASAFPTWEMKQKSFILYKKLWDRMQHRHQWDNYISLNLDVVVSRFCTHERVVPFTCSSYAKWSLRLQASVLHLIQIFPPTRLKNSWQISPKIGRLSRQSKCHATPMPQSHHFPMLNKTCAKPDYFTEEHVQKLLPRSCPFTAKKSCPRV